MQEKKNPKFKLENYSKIFMQLGLVVALFVVYVVIEQKTYERNFNELSSVQLTPIPEEIPPIIIVKEPELPKPKPVLPTEQEIIKNNDPKKEDIFKTTEPNEEEPTFNLNTVETVPEEDPIVENVPFILIEDVPVFPGCKGDNDALRSCFNKKMQRHFAKKFDSDLPNELGLPPGKKRILMLFRIDKTGNITDIRVKAPHPKLEKETKRIIRLLPQMKPGMQRGNPVGVKYTLPMRIDVE